MDNFWWLLVGMSFTTFTCRYLFLTKTFKFELGQRAKRLLSYTAPSVLTAMWVPIVFLGHLGTEQAFVTSPFLWAGVLALILSLRCKNMMLVVCVSLFFFALLKFASV